MFYVCVLSRVCVLIELCVCCLSDQYTMRHFKQRKIVALPPPPSHSQPFSSSSSSSSADATGSEISDTLLKMVRSLFYLLFL